MGTGTWSLSRPPEEWHGLRTRTVGPWGWITGNGVFGAPVTIYSGSGDCWIHFVKDSDGDGDNDLLIRTGTTTHTFFLNNGPGVFTQSGITVTSNYGFQDMVDMNGDGDLDLYYVYQHNVAGMLTV